MRLGKVFKSGLLALLPVVVVLAGWIGFVPQSRVELSRDMNPGFLVPRTAADAVRSD